MNDNNLMLQQDSNAAMNIREYFDSRSQNLPGHSPVSVDEYEGSEVDYRNSEQGNISDYEQNTFDNGLDEQNGNEDPSQFRCMTPGSNLPIRGSSGVQQRHDDDMLESISSDAIMMIPDGLVGLTTSNDLDETGHFTAGLARATAGQSFTNGAHNPPSTNSSFMNISNSQTCQPSEDFFGTNMTFPEETPSTEQPIRSAYIDDSWAHVPSKSKLCQLSGHFRLVALR